MIHRFPIQNTRKYIEPENIQLTNAVFLIYPDLFQVNGDLML